MNALPRYAELEVERRWLVAPGAVDVAGLPRRTIQDRYLDGTRMRLRKITDANGVTVFKLGKKYGKRGACVEPVTTLYLTETEHAAFDALPGAQLTKARFTIAGGALDVFAAPHDGLVMFSIELDSEDAARDYLSPPFVGREVTDDEAFGGHALARASVTGAR